MKGPNAWKIIIFGLLIDNEDGHARFKKTYYCELLLVIPIELEDLVKEKDPAFGCNPVQRRLELELDFLVITQIERGPFAHDGPEAYDEVLQEDRNPIPNQEEKIKAWLENELGKLYFLGSLAPRSLTLFG